MNNSKSILISIILGCSLSGCMGVYEEGFDCPPGIGVGCKSISQVNTMVNKGLLPRPEIEVPQEHSPENHNLSNSCKNCVSTQDTSSPNLKINPSQISIWWAPQWEDKAPSKPVNITPVKG